MALDLMTSVRDESARFAEALRGVDPAARVPSCPDWTAADLLHHLAEVHWFWASIVSGRISEGVEVEALENGAPSRPDDYADLLAFYDETTEDMLRALDNAADEIPVWTWAADQSVGFVRRFQAHEAMIHRVDAELTAGAALTPLPDELADDGIDVVLNFQKTWRPGWADWQLSDDVGRVHATDTDRRWTFRLGRWSGTSPDTGKTYDGEDAIEVVDDEDETALEPTFTVHGTTADLDAWLWHRPGFGAVEQKDGPGYERFAALVTAGVQ